MMPIVEETRQEINPDGVGGRVPETSESRTQKWRTEDVAIYNGDDEAQETECVNEITFGLELGTNWVHCVSRHSRVALSIGSAGMNWEDWHQECCWNVRSWTVGLTWKC